MQTRPKKGGGLPVHSRMVHSPDDNSRAVPAGSCQPSVDRSRTRLIGRSQAARKGSSNLENGAWSYGELHVKLHMIQSCTQGQRTSLSLIFRGSLSTSHWTISEHGGVVKDPSYVKKSRVFGTSRLGENAVGKSTASCVFMSLISCKRRVA